MQIDGCDVREGDMDFLRSTFGVKAWTVGFDFAHLTIAERYDLIWVGSIITHFPEAGTRRLISKLVSSLNPGGLLAVSFHGRYVIHRRESGAPEARYIHDKGWKKIKSGYRAGGYGYADFPNRSGYGMSVTSAPWMTKFVESFVACGQIGRLRFQPSRFAPS
jgi:SAM-dependent methyltransferase